MAILVTGGAGFIGSHLVERLRQDQHSVIVLDNFSAVYDQLLQQRHAAAWSLDAGIQIVQGSFGDQALLERLFAAEDIHHVIHLGGSPGVRESVANPARYFANNVDNTLTLLEMVRRTPVKRFLFASSSTVYGKGAVIPFVEDAPLGVPYSPYGASKRSAELLCQTYHLLHGVPAVVLRLFNVYGPRLRPELALSVFTRAICRGEKLPLYGDGSVRRDFAHVNDVVDGINAALIAENVAGEAINLGNHRPQPVRELIRLIESAAGKAAQIEHYPTRPEEMPETFADLTKAQRLLHYVPRVTLEEGVKDFVRWWQETHS